MIRPAMTVWRDVTKILVALTNQTPEELRDDTITEIEARLDDRDKLQLLIAAPFTAEEAVFGKELITL